MIVCRSRAEVTSDPRGGVRVTPEPVRTEQYTHARASLLRDSRPDLVQSGRVDCFECAQERMKAKRPPRKPRGGMPTYTDRPPRPAPPMTPAQTDAAEDLAVANGYRRVNGSWQKRW